MKITIIGTGYVVLVTGSCLAETGNQVICVDNNKKKINLLKNCKSPIYEQNLQNIISKTSRSKCLKFTSNIKESIELSDIIIITVGTPMNKDGSSNLKSIYNIGSKIGEYINSHKIIITKSTIPVGTTYKLKDIINKKIKQRDVKLTFDIANNPEFLKEGKAISDFKSPDRIIVGIENNKIEPLFKELYKPFSINHDKLIFMDIASSELTKYAANAMLATKISFINEIALIAEKFGANINAIRKGIGSDTRIGYNYIYPSIGFGGSCLPKDIQALKNFSKEKGYSPKIIDAVDKINQQQKIYFLKKVIKRLAQNNSFKNLCFGIWGLSYKPGTNDLRESPSIYIINQIIKLGGKVKVYDPEAIENAKNNYFKNIPIKSIIYCKNKYDVLTKSSCLILLTEWPEFRSPDFKLIKSKLKSPIIFDGKNQYNANTVQKYGIEYFRIGSNN